MVIIRISKKFKHDLDLIKIGYIKAGKKPPSYEKIIRNKIKNKKKEGLLYDEIEYF